MNTDHKIILVTRPTRLAELVLRFNTVSQARFYIEHQGADFADYLREDQNYHQALIDTQVALGRLGRVQIVDRAFLPNFVFAPNDTVVTLGQDGLVANTLKYLNGQPLVGVNPDPARWDGKLLPFRVCDLDGVMPEVLIRHRPIKTVTMAKATLNNGQTLLAVNDIFVGPKSHTSARYIIRCGQDCETQSSSGVVISTGMGSTGWLKSLLTGATAVTLSAGSISPGQAALHESVARARPSKDQRRKLPQVRTEFPWDASYLFFTVREPFPTKTTGATLVFGRVTSEAPLRLESRMSESGVIFSDGIEKDFLEFNSGTQAVIGLAERQGLLVT
ncbi:MAG TPA: sugar kinase [Verrucomicrobiae bacterium]|nr:sugar kinase [Verrucomicrobiae bacterium]